MPNYEVRVPESVESTVAVTCLDHDISETYPSHRRAVDFHCPDCGVELSVALHDAAEYRPWDGGC